MIYIFQEKKTIRAKLFLSKMVLGNVLKLTATQLLWQKVKQRLDINTIINGTKYIYMKSIDKFDVHVIVK